MHIRIYFNIYLNILICIIIIIIRIKSALKAKFAMETDAVDRLKIFFLFVNNSNNELIKLFIF